VRVERTPNPAGASYSDVVAVDVGDARFLHVAGQITTYLTALDDYADFAAVRARMFGDTLPASAAVAVAALLGDVLVEVQAVAVVAA
jgi:hypothetical protein